MTAPSSQTGVVGAPASRRLSAQESTPSRVRVIGTRALLVAGVVLAAAMPVLARDYAQQYLMAYMAIVCLLALTLHLCMGLAGIFTLGQAAQFGTGAYLGVVLMENVGFDGVVALPLVALAGGVLGVLMAVVTIRTTDLYLALITLAFGFIGENVVRNSEYLGGASGLAGFGLNIFGEPLDEPKRLYWVGLFCVVLFMVVIASVRRSKIGRALMASRESPIAARSIGIDTRYYRLLALGIGGAFAAVAGSLYTAYALVLDPSVFGLDLTLAVLTIAIVGGLRSMPGVLIAAVLLTYFRNSAETFGVSSYVLLIYGLFVVLTLRFVPKGVGGLLTPPVVRPRALLAKLRPAYARSVDSMSDPSETDREASHV